MLTEEVVVVAFSSSSPPRTLSLSLIHILYGRFGFSNNKMAHYGLRKGNVVPLSLSFAFISIILVYINKQELSAILITGFSCFSQEDNRE
ncbi:hypothetical protein BKA57DRAFT_256241 [Linnemannia elongata]|nr:hypothetical protein BKA57DRAFT_256241 [Linnemannia elongata]